MQIPATVFVAITALLAGSSVLATGPPPNCKQTSNKEWGGYCICTTEVVTSTVTTITSTVPVTTTVSSNLFGPTCFPPSPYSPPSRFKRAVAENME